MDYDAIIVGSGLAGLVAGAKLAKEGKKVLILEQHITSGGYASGYTRDDYRIDLSLHSMDGLHALDPKIRIFEELDVIFNIEFIKIKTGYYRYKNSRVDFNISDKIEDAILSLSKLYPNEKKNIEKFFKTLSDLEEKSHNIPTVKAKQALTVPLEPTNYSSIPKWGDKSAGDLLDTIFENEDLKLALTGTLQYYSDNPYNLSAVFYSLALSSRFKGGSHYIKGGSVKLSNHLANFIKEKGGGLIFDRKVSKILIKGNKAYGVEYVSTKRRDSQPVQVLGKYVIVNAPVPHAVNELIPAKQSKSLKEEVNKLKVGHSTLNIFLCFNTLLSELGHNSYSTVVHEEGINTLADLEHNNKQDYSKRNYIFIDYGQIESGLTQPGKSTGTVSVIDYLENWEGLTEDEYNKKKLDVTNTLIDRVNRLIPGVKQYIEFVDISTPLTKKNNTLNPNGTSIGFAQTINQAGQKRFKVKSTIKNLFFTSAWTYPGGGYSSSFLSGWQCALNVLDEF
ncbi:MAG: NAD(P)/FAD-dependent oxidoreductase [Candidatus Heimdallarchaeota archaeon]|nr:NAD(P)/FAD-dependent oxidoreductase [Candidatus Heimdallarchaeota archaeon]